MSELYTKSDGPVLKYKYIGDKISASGLLYTPIKIHHFELIESRFNKGKFCLIAQISRINKKGEIENLMLETEASLLVHTIDTSNREPPFETKIVKNKKNTLQFVKLNKP